MTNIFFSLVLLLGVSQAYAGQVEDGSDISGTFQVQEKTPECFSDSLSSKGTIDITADESGVTMPFSTVELTDTQMLVGDDFTTTEGGGGDVYDGVYKADGFYYTHLRGDGSRSSTTSTTITFDSKKNVLVTFVPNSATYPASTPGTPIYCHLVRVN